MTDVTLRATKGSPLTHTEMDNNQIATKSGRKNMIIGGNFGTNPWQRAETTTAAGGGYINADRFQFNKSNAAVMNVAKAAGSPTVAESGILSTHCYQVDVTTADTSVAASDYHLLEYRMEGHDYAQIAQKPFVLSFWHGHTKTGVYCVAFRNSVGNKSFVAEYTQTTSNTWEKAIIKVPASPASGTWNYTNGIGLFIEFTFMAGSDWPTTAGSWVTGNKLSTTNQVNALDSNSNFLRFNLIQLEAGIEATDFERRTVAEEVALCQRYYEKTYNMDRVPGTVVDASRLISRILTTVAIYHMLNWQYKVTKRTIPTVTTYSPQTGAAGTMEMGTTVAAPAAAGNLGVNTCYVDLNTATASSSPNHSVSCHLTANAEL